LPFLLTAACLTSNMNTRFESVASEEELETAGGTCIICRDRMEVKGIHGDCKKLPMCGHTFHKHCLREWLVQQQSCPTCRGDIQANEARARAMLAQDNQNEADVQKNNTTVVDAEREIDKASNVTSEEQPPSPNPPFASNLTHPILYRVVAPSGAAMYEFDEEHDFGSDTTSKEARKPSRILKCGTIVVCTASQNCACDMSSNSDSTHDLPRSQTYLKAPGGWIPASAMKELMHLKPRKRVAAVDSSKMAHTS